jgi:putative oxidoreductase
LARKKEKRESILKYIFLLGRVLFSSIFILKSFELFTSDTIIRAKGAGLSMANVLVPLFGILVLLGGVSMLLGYKAKKGAWLLVIFLLPATLLMHRFWSAENPFAAMMHNYCFWKNVSLLGAALMITHFGSGPMSLDKNPHHSKK